MDAERSQAEGELLRELKSGVEGRNPLRRFLGAYAIVLALLLVVAVVAHWAGVSLLPADDSPGLLLLVLGLAVAAYFLLFLIGVGYYIYHDAERRGMSPLLWALVCVLAPYFIGLIVYLVVRSPLPARCPACGASAPRESAFCPKCGKRIRRQCPSCHATLDEGYRFCPTCGAAVDVLQA